MRLQRLLASSRLFNQNASSYAGQVRDFYAQRLYQPAWSDQFGELPQAGIMIEFLDQAIGQGLSIRSLHCHSIYSLRNPADVEAPGLISMQLTGLSTVIASACRFACARIRGRATVWGG